MRVRLGVSFTFIFRMECFSRLARGGIMVDRDATWGTMVRMCVSFRTGVCEGSVSPGWSSLTNDMDRKLSCRPTGRALGKRILGAGILAQTARICRLYP